VPQEPSDTEFAKILDDVAESDWIYGNWTYSLAEMLYDGHIFGTGLGGLGYDSEARFGQGSITFESEDPFYCFPDPNAQDVNTKCRNFTIAKPMDIDVLKGKYPEYGKFIKPDLIDLVQGNKTEIDPIRFKSPVDNNTVIEGSSSHDVSYRNQALEVTCYLFDSEVIEESQDKTDPTTGQVSKSYIQKLKYPLGRKIVVAGGVVVEDCPLENEDKIFPFVRYANYIDPRCFWGISEVEQLKGPQNIFNKIYSFVLDVMTLMGNPIWVVDNDSDIDTDNLITRPGLVVEKSKGSEVRREEGTQLQPYVLQILDRVREYIDSVSGSNDVTRGVKPDGVTAASAIQSLQEAAQTRIRQKSRNLDATLQQFGKIYKSIAMAKYDTPRVFRLTNEQGTSKYFKFHIEKQTDEEGNEIKVARVRRYNQDPETGAYAEDINEETYQLRGDFDVRISTGSSLPFAKDQKFAKARQMFLDGVIDDEEYLKQSDYPNWQAVLERVNQKKMAEQQAAMAAQGGGAPQGPPPPPPA
jgi:hypothetical protein